MNLPHLFEFMDLEWLPSGLAATLREILSCGNARPFRGYYRWIADEIASIVNAKGFKNVAELGAGTAPISRLLAERSDLPGVRLIVCDGRPDVATYRDLESTYPEKVFPRHEAVDFSRPQHWPPETLLVLSGTFHHIPRLSRMDVVASLSSSAAGVLIVEPLRKTLSSALFVFLSTVPAIVLPLWYLRRPGTLRRIFWCWLFPVAPVMFWWDGVASCLRMWSDAEWDQAIPQVAPPARKRTIRHSIFSQLVSW